MTKHVYSIAAGQNFSQVFAQYLLQKTAHDSQALAHYRILLPTRRACRVLRDAFLRLNDGQPMLLPAMSPIGEVDAQDLSLMTFGAQSQISDVPEAISPLQRQFMLAKLIQSLPDFVQGPDHALALAQHLCVLIDQILVEELDFTALETLVPEDFAAHWQVTLDFLKIVSEHWPRILKENHLIESVERRRLMLQTLAQHWSDHPPDNPVIAAGVTGSIPVVGRFLSAVASLPNGSVVLPGLDCDMDDEAWDYIAESHPQHVLKNTLARIDVLRKDVGFIGSDFMKREPLARQVMLPYEVSARWSDVENNFSQSLEGLQYYACKNEHQEAVLIALMMRETLEKPGEVCALVTPDRRLARRVRAACRRWNIDVDDSAGHSLHDTDLGKFSLLILNVVTCGYDPVAFLALLKSPLCRAGRGKAVCRRLTGILELDVMRNHNALSSFNALREKIENQDVLSFFDDVYAQLYRLIDYQGDFLSLFRMHLEVMEQLAVTDELPGADRLWRGDVGDKASQLFTDVLQHGALIGDVSVADYERVFRTLLQGAQTRSAYGVHPRLLILGQLEARLTRADRVILGGLNEGTWTPSHDFDPWMSKPMRTRFGLPGHDQAIGFAAHDFVQGFCGGDVILTRSLKVDRSPSLPVRWLVRLEMVLKAQGIALGDLSDPSYLHWVQCLDDFGDFEPCERPAPKPPVSARPSGASVTKIAKWLQDPYSIYAYYVLGLKPVEPLIQSFDMAMRGTILHETLELFSAVERDACTQERFIQVAQDVIKARGVSPDVLHHWWPKLLQIAAWFVAHENEWRTQAKFLCSEVRGKVALDIDGVPFTLYGQADRIDRMAGGYAIIDYKSGGSFSMSGLKQGRYPQMPLEALILNKGGFEGVEAGAAQYFGYWTLTGGRVGGKVVAIDYDVDDVVALVDDGLRNLIRGFRSDDVPFYSLPDILNIPRFNDYEHLARVKEWAALGGEEEV